MTTKFIVGGYHMFHQLR